MKHAIIASISLVFLAPITGFAAQSSAAFYGKPAGWLFDLIQNPTFVRTSTIEDNGIQVGFTQYEICASSVPASQCHIGDLIECSAHGKTAANPTHAEDAQLLLCTVKADTVQSIFDNTGGGSFSFAGGTASAAQVIFGYLPKTMYSIHDTSEHATLTSKSFGQAGVDGIMCSEQKPDAPEAASTYNCSLEWLP